MEDATPMMRQYHEIKREHPDALLFFRLGDFYELFYEDAVVASRDLEITLTSRNSDRNGKPIPMCGVPHHSAHNYLARLIRKGHRVAVCEQVEDPRQAKGVVRREVTRVVTPGTAVEDSLLEVRENNYLAALEVRDTEAAVALLDVSTGEFRVTLLEEQDPGGAIEREMAHFNPTELVLPEEESERLEAFLPEDLLGRTALSRRPGWTFNADYAERILQEHFGVSTLDGFGLSPRGAGVSAAGALLDYVRHTQKSALRHVLRLECSKPTGYLSMDEATIRNLELVRGMDGNRRWTLLGTLDRTRTGMGARLLRRRLLRPSLDLEEIDGRLDAVEELTGNVVRAARLGEILEGIHDVERLLSRVTLETANARDLLSLGASLQKLPTLRGELESYRSALLKAPFDLLEEVTDLILRAVDQDAPATLNEGGLIRTGFDEDLDRLREVSGSGKSFIAGIESRERERTGIGSLKVKYNKVFGYFIEVTRANLEAVPDDYVRKQTLVNCERFVTPELKEYEEQVLKAEERILSLEKELFAEVRRRIGREAARIQETARRVALLDVLTALAETAHRNGYVRPRLDGSLQLDIREGRHPVLERQGKDPFVPNDLFCNTESDQLLILTGPNMGGKSTFLRQNALIVILAQMGSFVPAEEARIGLVDRIYTRVGAGDNLARGRSTFMVEMIETAHILNTATPRSLILLDEVGRGTATFDGLSIAWSVAEYLVREESRRARTLFATHYLELTRLADLYEGVRNYCLTVRESGGDILFFHRVLEGVANKSYGIEVARLAGLPAPVLARAREILTRLERKQMNLAGPSSSRTTHEVIEELQKPLFEVREA